MGYAIVTNEFYTLGGVAVKVLGMPGGDFPRIVCEENGKYRELTDDEYAMFFREYQRVEQLNNG